MNLNLKIRQVIQETPDAITIEFERPAGIDFKSGQFLTLINTIDGKEVRRSYSLCTAPYEKDKLAVSIKRVEGGLVSNYLNDKASSMTSMEVVEPMGKFILNPDSTNSNNYILFAGGSGITPMMSIIKTVLEKEPNSYLTLIYANTDEQSIIFKDALNSLQEANQDRFKIIHVIENPSDQWTGRYGRLNGEEVVKLVESISIPASFEKIYYMCGPTGYMDQIEAGLNLLHVPKDKVHKESFVSAGSTEASDEVKEGGNRTVKIIFDGDEYQVEVEPGESILDAGLDDDIDLPYSCQSGVCTACRGKCLSGKVDLSEVEGLSDQEIDEGYVLCCVGYPLTDDVVIEIG